MHNTPSDNRGNPTIWLNIDPVKVKQRIEAITRQIDKVRRQEKNTSKGE